MAAWRHFDALLVALLAAVVLGLRWRTLWTSYWGDEAIAIGIAAQPLHALPKALVEDGSPPLYYVLLHFWMEAFGRSELATHWLSMTAALATVPASWWCGCKLFGRWAGRAAAALVATCAYVGYYSTETRMYSWLVLAALLALTCFFLAYQGAGRWYWLAAWATMTATLYLHYYGLYLFGALVVVGAGSALVSAHRARLRATLSYALACGAAFAPWVPQFAYQVAHTGAPWAPRPSVADLVVDPFNALASAAWPAVVIALVVAALAGLRHLLAGRPEPRLPKPLSVAVLAVLRLYPGSSGPGYELGAEGLAQAQGGGRSPGSSFPALGAVAAVPVVALVLAWTGSQLVNSWDPRYLGVAIVPALVPLAAGLARARGRLPVVCGTVLALAATAAPAVLGREVTVETSKSDAAYILDRLRGLLRPGDLVVSAQVTDAPVVALDLGPRYAYATPLGLEADPLVVNWSNLPTRLQGVNAASNLAPLLADVPAGGHVLLVDPASWDRGETPQRYAGAVEAEAIAANQVVLSDPDLQVEQIATVPAFSSPLYPMNATLFVRTAGRA